jgi:hypothetical protein
MKKQLFILVFIIIQITILSSINITFNDEKLDDAIKKIAFHYEKIVFFNSEINQKINNKIIAVNFMNALDLLLFNTDYDYEEISNNIYYIKHKNFKNKNYHLIPQKISTKINNFHELTICFFPVMNNLVIEKDYLYLYSEDNFKINMIQIIKDIEKKDNKYFIFKSKNLISKNTYDNLIKINDINDFLNKNIYKISHNLEFNLFKTDENEYTNSDNNYILFNDIHYEYKNKNYFYGNTIYYFLESNGNYYIESLCIIKNDNIYIEKTTNNIFLSYHFGKNINTIELKLKNDDFNFSAAYNFFQKINFYFEKRLIENIYIKTNFFHDIINKKNIIILNFSEKNYSNNFYINFSLGFNVNFLKNIDYYNIENYSIYYSLQPGYSNNIGFLEYYIQPELNINYFFKEGFFDFGVGFLSGIKYKSTSLNFFINTNKNYYIGLQYQF